VLGQDRHAPVHRCILSLPQRIARSSGGSARQIAISRPSSTTESAAIGSITHVHGIALQIGEQFHQVRQALAVVAGSRFMPHSRYIIQLQLASQCIGLAHKAGMSAAP